jgi:hypothetical protein
LVGHHPSTRQLANPSSQGGRAAASTVAALSLWICGRRADTAEEGPSDRPPPTTPQAQQQQQEGCLSMNFTHSIFKRGKKYLRFHHWYFHDSILRNIGRLNDNRSKDS